MTKHGYMELISIYPFILMTINTANGKADRVFDCWVQV